MSVQPEALRLAECLEELDGLFRHSPGMCAEAAAELRRLHAANIDCVDHFNAIKAERDELLKALDDIAAYYPNSWASDTARAAIAKASA